MKKKVWIALSGIFLMTAGLCGCQKSEQPEVPDLVEEQTNAPEPTATPEPTAAPATILTIADISSKDLVADMKIGWNLGNTLDATGGMGIMSETAWGNPKTKQEMIDAVLDAGFNVIRIPVTWDGHFGGAPDYKIHDIWLQRVKEVVDYAYNKGAYVILNMHHEEWYFPTEDTKEENGEQIAALWTQIAEYFKEYDEHLVFEGLNEPRKRGTSLEWTGDAEAREVINYWEQIFVDTVRATGGNNTLRHLMITGYAASSAKENLAAIRLPEDDKLIVSVHAYTPYNFALNTAGTSTWDAAKDNKDIDYFMQTLDELFVSQGIPVIIGEFGAMNKENEAERVEWVQYYLTKAQEIGVPCVWWDNNAFIGSGENFGLFDRRAMEFPYQDLLDAMMQTINK
ncbi:MAG: glycoside hydrolase family 5 protein [Lachnospiraceae bacterium]|nr:glycoside hydrolase family 5 protein [Lachnospiraceae bacterium]MBP3609837.1 glycoside hydrolase family 5 protein [Lachnospiraceae bacterium]